MNLLEQKIKDIISADKFYMPIEMEVHHTENMKLLARFIFNELYPCESTGEVEPWATKEQQEGQETWASGWNALRKQMRDKAVLLGIIKNS